MPPFGTLTRAHPLPSTGQDVQGFQRIIQSMARIETMRQNRMIESSVLAALSRGASAAELAEIAGQPVQFDEGIPGFFQRISAKFAGPGQTKTALTQGLMKEAISPDKVTMTDIRMREYLKAVQAGDKERADKLLMSSLVTIQTGEKLWTPEQRQASADRKYEKEMGLTPTQQNNARKSVKTIVQEMGTRTWKWGTRNYARGNLIQGYKQYRTENDYASKTAEHQKWLDKNWDDQMMTYNKGGYKDIGKNEFDWDPKDARVLALRKENLGEGKPAEKARTLEDMRLLSDEELKRIAEGG